MEKERKELEEIIAKLTTKYMNRERREKYSDIQELREALHHLRMAEICLTYQAEQDAIR